MGAAIDVQDLTRDEGCFIEKEDGIDDLARRPHPTHGVKACEKSMGLVRVHRCLDRARRNGIHPEYATTL
jgi:hypothetical protein